MSRYSSVPGTCPRTEYLGLGEQKEGENTEYWSRYNSTVLTHRRWLVQTHIWLLNMTVSRAKTMDASRPKSRFNRMVHTRVTTHTIYGSSTQRVY